MKIRELVKGRPFSELHREVDDLLQFGCAYKRAARLGGRNRVQETLGKVTQKIPMDALLQSPAMAANPKLAALAGMAGTTAIPGVLSSLVCGSAKGVPAEADDFMDRFKRLEKKIALLPDEPEVSFGYNRYSDNCDDAAGEELSLASLRADSALLSKLDELQQLADEIATGVGSGPLMQVLDFL